MRFNFFGNINLSEKWKIFILNGALQVKAWIKWKPMAYSKSRMNRQVIARMVDEMILFPLNVVDSVVGVVSVVTDVGFEASVEAVVGGGRVVSEPLFNQFLISSAALVFFQAKFCSIDSIAISDCSTETFNAANMSLNCVIK
jgi:hypothetical protein